MPYQAKISQGRLEALINFQTMVCDLTGMPMAKRGVHRESHTFIVAGDCHPQTIKVIQTRGKPLGITIRSAPRPPACRS